MNKNSLGLKEHLSFKNAVNEIKSDFSKQNIKKTIYRYLLIILGSALIALSSVWFLIPFNIVNGGVSGIGIVFKNAFNLNENQTNLTITILQLALFFLGYFLLGASFTLKTLIATIFYPLFLYGFTAIYDNVPLNWHLAQTLNPTIQSEPLAFMIATIVGGGLVGVGVGITFAGGGSTGGVDCLGLFAAKKFHIKASITTFIIDFLIILANCFVSNDLATILVGIISAYMMAALVDKTYITSSKSFMAFIISDKYQEINNQIINYLPRGTTLVKCLGGYTNKDKTMIQVAFNYEEYDNLQNLVYKIDPHAFMTICQASEINGYGFKRISIKTPKQEKNNKE